MDLLHLVARAAFAYVVLLLLVRFAGKRTIREATAFDLTVAVVLGELFDGFLGSGAPVAQWLVATGTLIAAHTAVASLVLSAKSKDLP